LYGLLLWLQTLLAMVALGVAGGWVLWEFRSPQRPYLWLAAPLAGVAALAGALVALYFGCRLPFGQALLVSWLGLASATLVCLLRGVWRLPSLKEALIPLAAVACASAWATYACNWTSMREREPTLAMMHGSDIFGYAMAADWVAGHPATQPPQPSRVFEMLPYVLLHLEGSRPAAYLLNAAAGCVRHTSATFSYDWACGVMLACAAAGLGGLFAAGPTGLLLLLGATASSAWLAVSREGYLGKTLCYPGCVLLGALCHGAWLRPSFGRFAAACLVGPGVALCLNPVVPAAVVGLVLGSFIVGLLLARLCSRRLMEFPNGTPPFRRLLMRALVLHVAVTGPALALNLYLYEPSVPRYDGLSWDVVLPAALDLENPYLKLLVAQEGVFLVLGCLATTLVLLLLAIRQGNGSAQGYLLCTALVPCAWLIGDARLYGFHGILYPLAVAGAVLLLNQASLSAGWRRAMTPAVCATLLVALHVPQAWRSARCFLARTGPVPLVLTRSEIETIRDRVGDQAIDVSLGDWPEALAVITELGCHGTRVVLRSPAWERTLANWAAYGGYSRPADLAKTPFSIVERDAFAPTGTVRYCGKLLKLCADASAVTFFGYHNAEAMAWVGQRTPGLWLGNRPVIVDIYNGTGNTAFLHFLAESHCGPGSPEISTRTLVYSLGYQEGSRVLGPAGWTVDLPLEIAPGLNQLVLSVAEPAATAPPQLLLLVTKLRLVAD
jgi:hypothetical protein